MTDVTVTFSGDASQLAAATAIVKAQLVSLNAEARTMATAMVAAGRTTDTAMLSALSSVTAEAATAQASLAALSTNVASVGSHMAGTGLTASYVTREIRALADEASSGRWRQFDGSLVNLAFHGAGVVKSFIAANPLLAAFGVAAAAAAGAVGYLVFEAHEAAEAVKSIELGAAVAGFNLTSTAAAKLRDSIEQLANVSASNAASIADAFAPLGPVGATVAQLVSPHLQNLADAMGKKIPEAADELAKSFINSDTTGKKLIENSRVMTQAQKEQYAAFVSSGDRIGQYGLLVLELNNRLSGFEGQQKATGAATRSFSEDLAIAAAAEGGFDIAEQVMSAQLARTTTDIQGQERALGMLRLQLAMTANDATRASAGIAKATAEGIRAHDLTFKGSDVQKLTEDKASEQALAVNPDASVDARKEASLKVLEYDKQINAASYADFEAAENLKVAAAGKNSAAVIAIRQQEAAKARELFGAGSNEERAAIEAVARAKEEAANRGAAAAKSAARDALADQQTQIQGEIAAVKEASDLKIQTYKDEMKLKQRSEKDGTAAVVAELAKQKAAVDALYASEIALAGQKAAKVDQIQNQEAAYNAKNALAMLEAQAQAAQKSEQAWDKATSGINSAFDSQVAGLLKGTTSWGQAFKNVLTSLTEDVIKFFLNLALKTVETAALQVAAQNSVTSGVVAALGLQAAASTAASKVGVLAMIQADAGEAFAGFAAFFAPTLGPGAIPAAAGLAGQVTATASGIAAYASGTDYVPQTGLALVHQGEKIIPANLNTSGYGGVVHNHTWNITGGANADPREIAREVARQWNSQPSLRPIF